MIRIVLVPTLIVTLIRGVCCKDNDFLKQYELFRFSLYSYVKNDVDEFRITREMTASIDSFLNTYSSKIVNYRKNQLEKYQRDDLDNPEHYHMIDTGFISKVKESVVLLYPYKKLRKNSNDLSFNDPEYGALQYIKLFSADPLMITSTVSSQITPMILTDYLNMTSDQMTKYYTRLAICGYYISTKVIDKNKWEIKVNSYQIIYKFTFDVKVGTTSLDGIWLLSD